MRKLLISILIALLLIITIYSVYKGLSIGNIKILGFDGIRNESQELDKQIEEITRLKEQNYRKTISDIESNAKLLLQEKEKYATLVSTSTESEIEKATHGQNYEQDFLWAKIGNHATAQGVKLKFDIAIGAVNKENYDLYFTVTGKYTNITEFVMAIENDNLLGFKIENFKLIPAGSTTAENTNSAKSNTTTNKNNKTNNTNTSDATSEQTSSGDLQATFKVTDVQINIDRTKIQTNTTNMENTTEGNVVDGETEQTNNTTTTEETVE